MFCYQCEQTAQGTGCTAHGVCGKDPETAALQDLLIHVAEGVSQYAHRARKLGVTHRPADLFVVEALFATVTNVDFDPERVAETIRRGASVRSEIKAAYEKACQDNGQEPEGLATDAAIEPAQNLEALIRQGEDVTIQKRIDALGNDVAGLQELITYGLKGMAAESRRDN
jgi:hydroxylamine reductase